MDFLRQDDLAFSNGGDRLENLHYVVFSRKYLPRLTNPLQCEG